MNKKAKAFDTMTSSAKGTKEKIFLRAVQLFSDKGYSSVGIRQLCALVGIKEASFYNHFKSKEALLEAILDRWREVNERTIVDEGELIAVSLKGGPKAMIGFIMDAFAKVTNNPLVHAILAIVRMEGFTNARARAIAVKNMYYYRKGFTLAALRAMHEAGMIADLDLEYWTASYYYGLIGILDEYVLRELSEEDIRPMMARIKRHMNLFARMLESGK
jgi:AcrR family transcriptional regulator